MARKAILCGINAYADAPLKGCINDAENLRRLLIDTYGFHPDDIHLLRDTEAVKARLQQEWQWLTAGAGAGDILVFHFSGHGSNVPDLSGDETGDGRDEITCLADMDFHNPTTYLSDDEWFDWVEGVNEAADLIVIKDTCHSGGSSRAMAVLDAEGRMRQVLADGPRSRALMPGETVTEEQVGNARYLVPPDLPGGGLRGAGPAPRLRPSRLREARNLNLMACREDQTAADAYVDGRFQGAFTAALCAVLRQQANLDSRPLIEAVAARLRGTYEQVPVHEGGALPGPIFGAGLDGRQEGGQDLAATADVEAEATLAELPAPPVPPAGGWGEAEGAEGRRSLQLELIQAYRQLLKTVLALETGRPAAAEPEADGEEGSEARAGGRALVCVHGISTHRPGWSNGWWTSLAPHVGSTYGRGTLGVNRWEVTWSDLVNRGLVASRDPAMAAEAERLRQAIAAVIEDRRAQEAGPGAEPPPGGRGGSLAIDDFLAYMTVPEMRRLILQRFTDVVRPLLASGTTVDVMSHSWGTVVAYEGLRELEHQGLAGQVANWFTIGSALSIGPVQSSLRPQNRPDGAQRAPFPALVRNWINLDASGDLVGGPLRSRFPVHRDCTELVPVGCPRRLWGYDLGCAHGSYFDPANLAVNRDILAAHILGRA